MKVLDITATWAVIQAPWEVIQVLPNCCVNLKKCEIRRHIVECMGAVRTLPNVLMQLKQFFSAVSCSGTLPFTFSKSTTHKSLRTKP